MYTIFFTVIQKGKRRQWVHFRCRSDVMDHKTRCFLRSPLRFWSHFENLHHGRCYSKEILLLLFQKTNAKEKGGPKCVESGRQGEWTLIYEPLLPHQENAEFQVSFEHFGFSNIFCGFLCRSIIMWLPLPLKNAPLAELWRVRLNHRF